MSTTSVPRILIPLPDHDFDPTETAVPWQACASRGWQVTFATENGQVAAADPRLLLGFLRGPLGASRAGLSAYQAMCSSAEYQQPIRYAAIQASEYDALLLAGGHAPGMKQFLESSIVQEQTAQFMKKGKVVGAICHGLLVLARAQDRDTGRSVLYDYKTTSLTRLLESIGYLATFWLLGRRFRTYARYVEDEVRSVLRERKQYSTGLIPFPHVVVDRNLVTSRYWLFDASQFAKKFADLVESRFTR